MPLDLDLAIARGSARFAAVAAAGDLERAVPTCPGWSAAELCWHLTRVQAFWADVLETGGPDGARDRQVGRRRPGDRSGLVAAASAQTSRLLAALAAHPDTDPAWTWSTDHTVGFVRRRQAHEAAIHRLDMELSCGDRTALDPELAADGTDEVLRVIRGGPPPWATFTPSGVAVEITTHDPARSWTVDLGRITGDDPDAAVGDPPVTEAAVAVDDSPGAPGRAAVSVEGPASEVLCWLWGRPVLAPLRIEGSPQAVAALEEVIAAPLD